MCVIKSYIFFKSEMYQLTNFNAISITLQSAKSRHISFLEQNSVKFGTDLTQARKKFTQVLLTSSNVFQSLIFSLVLIYKFKVFILSSI